MNRPAILALLAMTHTTCNAGLVIDALEVEADVVFTGAGTLNTTVLGLVAPLLGITGRLKRRHSC